MSYWHLSSSILEWGTKNKCGEVQSSGVELSSVKSSHPWWQAEVRFLDESQF